MLSLKVTFAILGAVGAFLAIRLMFLVFAVITERDIDVRPGVVVVQIAIISLVIFSMYRLWVKMRKMKWASASSRAHPSDNKSLASRNHFMPVIGLLFLAPWIAEYLLGNISIKDIGALPILIPMYGGGALLIREAVRHTGRGWPAIFLLGAAYGLMEAGLFDMTLFNPPAVEGAIRNATLIPGLNVRALDMIGFVAGHAIWSIGLSIAVVEALWRDQRHTPWLRGRALIAVGLLYIAGGGIIFSEAIEGFTPSPLQVLSVVSIAVALIAAAFIIGKHKKTIGTASIPTPLQLGIGAFIAAAAFTFKPENWWGVGLAVTLLTATAICIRYWSRQQTWHIQHHFALIVAGTLTYAWLSFLLTALTIEGDARLLAWAGNALFSLLAIGLLILIAQRVKKIFVPAPPRQ